MKLYELLSTFSLPYELDPPSGKHFLRLGAERLKTCTDENAYYFLSGTALIFLYHNLIMVFVSYPVT